MTFKLSVLFVNDFAADGPRWITFTSSQPPVVKEGFIFLGGGEVLNLRYIIRYVIKERAY